MSGSGVGTVHHHNYYRAFPASRKPADARPAATAVQTNYPDIHSLGANIRVLYRGFDANTPGIEANIVGIRNNTPDNDIIIAGIAIKTAGCVTRIRDSALKARYHIPPKEKAASFETAFLLKPY